MDWAESVPNHQIIFIQLKNMSSHIFSALTKKTDNAIIPYISSVSER